ncbi:MAG: hypothetical protein WD491_12050 [Balneolales bacterium]
MENLYKNLFACSNAILTSLKTNEVPVEILRPKLIRNDQEVLSGDYDFIMSEEGFNEVLSIIYKHCKKNGLHFILNQKKPFKKVFSLFVDESSSCITYEFWPHIEFSLSNSSFKTAYISSKALLNSTAYRYNKAVVMTCIFITHLYYKSKDIGSAENRYRYAWYRSKLTHNNPINQRAKKILDGLFSGTQSKKQSNEKALLLLDELKITSSWPGGYRFKKLRYRTARRLRITTHKVIPMIGPDGVGKGSIQDYAFKQIKESHSPYRFKDLYRKKRAYRYILKFYKRSNQNPRNRIDEKVVHYIFWMSLFAFSGLDTNTRKYLLMDRYFTDYLATPLRFVESACPPEIIKFYSLYLYLIPTPQMLVWLGCKDESLIERKNELALISVRKLEQIYTDFICKKVIPLTLFLSTEQPQEVTSQILVKKLTLQGTKVQKKSTSYSPRDTETLSNKGA